MYYDFCILYSALIQLWYSYVRAHYYVSIGRDLLFTQANDSRGSKAFSGVCV